MSKKPTFALGELFNATSEEDVYFVVECGHGTLSGSKFEGATYASATEGNPFPEVIGLEVRGEDEDGWRVTLQVTLFHRLKSGLYVEGETVKNACLVQVLNDIRREAARRAKVIAEMAAARDAFKLSARFHMKNAA